MRQAGKILASVHEELGKALCPGMSTMDIDRLGEKLIRSQDVYKRQPLYGKIVKKTVKLKAHDENNECGKGDTVKVMETRPLSKDKRWRLVEIIEKAR